MSRLYVTIQNDRLDQICKAQYGTERNGTVEAVLRSNRYLAALGPLYDSGVEIFLPDLPVGPRTVGTVHLWD